MIGSDKECEAVLTQVMATKSALNQVGMHVIGHAMKTCLIDDTLSDRDALVSAAFGVYLHYRDLGGSKAASSTDLSAPDQLIDRLSTLEDQVRAVEQVIAAGGDCENALRELTAATATLNEVGLAILGRAMHRCLIDENATSRDEVIDQAIEVFLRYSSCVS
jgi:DNA-binding FrmR family transcriptional regulator